MTPKQDSGAVTRQAHDDLGEGWRLIGIGTLLLVCCAGPWLLALWTVRGGRGAAVGGAVALAGAAVACVAFGGAGFLALVAAAGAVALRARRLRVPTVSQAAACSAQSR